MQVQHTTSVFVSVIPCFNYWVTMQRCSFWSVVALLALALHAVGQPLITDTKVELPVLKHTEFDVGLELAWTEGSSPPNGAFV